MSIVDLYNCIVNVVNRANDELGCTSIAIPAISAGIFGFPIDLCAATIFEALEQTLSPKYSIASLGLREVKIVIIDDPTFLGVRREFYQRYPQAVSAKSGLPSKLTDQTDLEVRVGLPIVHPDGRKTHVDDAREKEPEERMVLEAIKEAKKKEE